MFLLAYNVLLAIFYQLLHLKCGPLFEDALSSQWFLIVQNVSSDLKWNISNNFSTLNECVHTRSTSLQLFTATTTSSSSAT